ncbi:hypothetical protein MN116_005598 [Schistosoma mekongi]|uniref:Uncharacterized protein n=1 Tax=Schistosoma mekongi TaxID=38744 RepID=A0AAE2D3V7_SCHME|nr:hypothetical protein MN116_005598 [Schistosoma mekongi]
MRLVLLLVSMSLFFLPISQIADSLASSLLPSAAKWCIIGNAPVGVWLTPDRNKEDTGIQVYFFNVYVDRHWYGDDLILNNNQFIF